MKRKTSLLALLILTSGCSDDPASGADAGPLPGDSAPALEAAAADASGGGPVIKTSSGSVRGAIQGKTRSFLGIPYAAPPVGAGRFAAPAPHPGWSAPRAATAFGAACPQVLSEMGKILPAGTLGPFSSSEDCLTLNVWTPWPLPAKAPPVLVWLHGGGFTGGASSLAHISPPGKVLAERHGLVVVSLNYRVGPLGFLAHPALGKTSGNYGILDQQAALKWVQLNIAAFGGDAKNVTLAGESAGAYSVGVHLTSPGSKWLFQRAVMESGACPQTFPKNATVMKRADAEAQGAKLATAVGCTTAATAAACLRGKTVKALLGALPISEDFTNASGGVGWGPNIDGATLSKQPLDLVRAGAVHKVPVLIGSNRDEGTFMVMAAKKHTMSKSEYTSTVNKMFGLGAFMVLGSYPASGYASGGAAMADILGDMVFSCTVRRSARALAAAGLKTYLYRFSAAPAYATESFLGAYHGAEVPFVFGSPPPGLSFTTKEAALAVSMMGYWARFARGGDPNGGGAPTWPAYAKATDGHLELGDKIAVGTGLERANCDFWDKLTP